MSWTFVNKKQVIKRPVHPPFLMWLPFSFFIVTSNFCHNKLCRNAKTECMMNLNQHWHQTPQGNLRAGESQQQQLLCSGTCWLRMSHKIWTCVCELLRSTQPLYCWGILELVLRPCVGGVNVFRQRSHADFYPTFSFLEVYFDIFCPTSNPAVKHCHLVFHTSQIKSFHTLL